MRKDINNGESYSLFGRTEVTPLADLELSDLIDDDSTQIVNSLTLCAAFISSSNRKKYYDEKKIEGLFKYVVYLYNCSFQEQDKYGALSYLTRISNLLDYIPISGITELSFEQLNELLDQENGDNIINCYSTIKRSRHLLTSKEYSIFEDKLRNTKVKVRVKEAKKVYDYISQIYNNNTILQDNINYKDYLDAFSKVNLKYALSMRMYQIIDMFNIKINYENINEEKKLVNDLTTSNCY